MNTVTAFAFAKLNLTLSVGKKMGDFHPLSSFVVPISLCDRVEMTPSEENSVTIINEKDIFGNCLPTVMQENNTVMKILQRFQSVFDTKERFCVRIKKDIPCGAGLGGSSADAGAVLRILCGIYDKNHSDVLEIASSVGKDVPFALNSKPCIMEGFGERLTFCDEIKDKFTLVNISTPNSTAEIFSAYDNMGAKELSTSNTWELYDFYRKNPLEKGLIANASQNPESLFINDLTNAARSVNPEMSEVIRKLEKENYNVFMSGSGSTLFIRGYYATELKNHGIEKVLNVETVSL